MRQGEPGTLGDLTCLANRIRSGYELDTNTAKEATQNRIDASVTAVPAPLKHAHNPEVVGSNPTPAIHT